MPDALSPGEGTGCRCLYLPLCPYRVPELEQETFACTGGLKDTPKAINNVRT